MEIICIVALCDCDGPIRWDIDEHSSWEDYVKCQRCGKIFKIDKLPLIDEIIEHDE